MSLRTSGIRVGGLHPRLGPIRVRGGVGERYGLIGLPLSRPDYFSASAFTLSAVFGHNRG
jgi:hypothetical protein